MNDLWFWLAAGGMTVAVGVILLMALLRGRKVAEQAEAYDLRVYRDQLREVEKDTARGVIAPEDAERARTEIARRVLEADRALRRGDTQMRTPALAQVVAAGLVALSLAVVGIGLYARVGAPGYGDLPLAQRIAIADEIRRGRPAQDAAEAEVAAQKARAETLPGVPEGVDPRYADLLEQLRAVVRARPDDVQGQQLLARNEAIMGNFDAAWRAQARANTLRGPAATADDHAAQAELMIMAAGGFISPEAEAALTEALRRDPNNGMALYYSGLLFANYDRADLAFRLWRRALDTSTPQDPWFAPIRAGIGELALMAGDRRYTPPPLQGSGAATPSGPSDADMAAAAEMSPEDRTQMIRGMVTGLSQRLATEGGTAEDWARLIRAYGVLGDRAAAQAIWSEAAQVFAARPVELAQVQSAARDAGVIADPQNTPPVHADDGAADGGAADDGTADDGTADDTVAPESASE